MNKKISFKFSKTINIMLALVAAICLAGVICSIVLLTLAVRDETPYVAYIVSITMSVLIFAIVIFVKFGSYYNFDKAKLIFSLFGLKKKIDYNDILSIRHDNITKQTIAYYSVYSKIGEKMVTMFILSVGDSLQEVVDFLKDKNNMIIYETFHEEDKNEKD